MEHPRKHILVIIPARGGSKSIPRKNLLLINNKPLLAFSIEAALQAKHELEQEAIAEVDVFVSSDDQAILEIGRLFGVNTLIRPAYLSEDHVPLDPVVCHAVHTVEGMRQVKFDTVVTLQPTSPLLRGATLVRAIRQFFVGEADTLISVSLESHIYWQKAGDSLLPLCKERRNRQWLEPLYRETGGFVISRRHVLDEGKRFGVAVEIYPLDFPENIDVDNWHDLVLVEACLKRKRIAIRTDGDRNMGLGHVYRMLTLAKRLWNHEVMFFMDAQKPLGVKKVESECLPVRTFTSDDELFDLLRKYAPDIVINDILDTETTYIATLKSLGCRVVNFEDLGQGARLADIVINALYEWSGLSTNQYYGYKYECLREDCYFVAPKQGVSPNVKEMVITFGGTDPGNTTAKVLKAIEKADLRDIRVKVVVGLGYAPIEQLLAYVQTLRAKGFEVEVLQDVQLMAPLLREADLVICSNGRTVYEAVAVAVPTVTISQNVRETSHLFSRISPGVINIGLSAEIGPEQIASTIAALVNDYEQRRRMHEELRPIALDLRKGIERVLGLILEGVYVVK
ncbi:MAG: UDP-2,4-diacetamido-2,4,6-trideoxy-beta-L-altropyranose hydrolase [Bacillota bacterium]|nr:UDP-2,4-diacetamido-2,4,6-trideoxy-beta-L-altropyranose hydrolase [Bacillota bacterium]